MTPLATAGHDGVVRLWRASDGEAASPEFAAALYESFVEVAKTIVDQVATGTFRADMQVELVNDGPVTILLDSRKAF